MVYKKVKTNKSVVASLALKKFLTSLEKKVNGINDKMDILLSDKSEIGVKLKGFKCQIEDISCEIKSLAHICSEKAEKKCEDYANSDKSKNIIIYGLDFGQKEDNGPILKLFDQLEIDLDKLGKISYSIQPTYKDRRSVCLVRFETLKVKKEVFRNCHKLKNLNLKVSICDDLSFTERVFRKHMLLKNKREGQHKESSSDQIQLPKEENVRDVDACIKSDKPTDIIQDSIDKQEYEEPVAHSSNTITKIIQKGKIEDSSMCFEEYMNEKYDYVAENIMHKYMGDRRSLKNTLKFFIKMRSDFNREYKSQGMKKSCQCELWENCVHLVPRIVEKQGIKYSTYQPLLYDLIEIFTNIKNELQITEEMDCICIRSDIEINILKRIENAKGHRPCRVD